MRDPKRIPQILKLVETLWKQYPDMRFGQLIEYIESKNDFSTDFFYLEDDRIELLLKNLLRKDK